MEEMRHEMIEMENYDLMTVTIDQMMEVFDKLDSSKKYIKSAIAHKAIDRSMADSMVNISAQELQHAETITDAVNRMMDKMKSENHPCYETMKKIWTHIHNRQVSYAAWIRQMHDRYKK